ncbi:hypothetical protein PUR49_01650, partial [Streptomyces sp. BE147]|nr:hypothetical protein [Streptomyces sp. BE147]
RWVGAGPDGLVMVTGSGPPPPGRRQHPRRHATTNPPAKPMRPGAVTRVTAVPTLSGEPQRPAGQCWVAPRTEVPPSPDGSGRRYLGASGGGRRGRRTRGEA